MSDRYHKVFVKYADGRGYRNLAKYIPLREAAVNQFLFYLRASNVEVASCTPVNLYLPTW